MSKISIIVPVYNSEKYLEKCIESILGQTYQDYELILANDGSTDTSNIICEKYLKKTDKIKILNLQHRGVSYARNQGILKATGEFICFIDSDDEVDKTYLETLILLQEKYNADIVEVKTCYMGNTSRKKLEDKEEVLSKQQMMYRLYSKEGKNTVLITNKLFKKNLFKEIEFDENHKNEDEFIIHKLIFETKGKIVASNKKLYFYRIHKNSRQRTFDSKKLDILEVYDEREKYFSTDEKLKIRNRIAKIDMILFLYSVCKKNKKKEEQEYLKEIFKNEYKKINFELDTKRKVKYFLFNKIPNIIANVIIIKRGKVI